VRDPRTGPGDYFVGNPDTFGGNSGSGVFRSDSLELFGVLISGDEDYVDDGGCQRVNVCPEGGCGGENILYARAAIDAYCAQGTDEVLCGTVSACGDGYCAWDEDAGSCEADCEAAFCGDGVCDLDDWSGCAEDCQVSVPPEWTCDPLFYGALDGCDCGCGVYDPDCDFGQEVLNCGAGDSCALDGTCERGALSFCEDCSSSPGDTRRGALALLLVLGLALAQRSASSGLSAG